MRIAICFIISSLLISCNRSSNSATAPDTFPPIQSLNYPSISDSSALRKISLHLKGIAPTETEYRQLLQLAPERRKSFMGEKIKEYLTTPEYVEKMNFRLNEYFKLRPQALFKNVWPQTTNGLPEDYLLNYNALNDLFREIARYNLPWDVLAVGNSYLAYSAASSIPGLLGVTDYQFFLESTSAPVPPVYFPKIEDPPPVPYRLDFPESAPQIAGAITTTRFFSRYTTTEINKNRRRAAAVFRLFLCDDMQASIPASANKSLNVSALAYPEPAIEQNFNTRLVGQHGADPSCSACHYKLDPMGHAFDTSPIHLGALAAPGALKFKDRNGILQYYQGQGIGDIARALVRTDDYSSCQVRRFWDWFIGENFPLSQTRERELIQVFNFYQRRTNDFIQFLLQLPEFTATTVTLTSQINFRAKNTLAKCANCHANAAPALPRFDVWPIGGSQETEKAWLDKIATSTGLYGAAPTMPPIDSDWQMMPEELTALKTWSQDEATK